MLIEITLPHFFALEAEAITAKFQSGLQRLHLRKPDSDIAPYRDLIVSIPECYHPRIVIHEHFQLLQEFNLCGVHLNRRCPEPPAGWTGHVSRSCHSIEEVVLMKEEHDYDYVTLSPIFDSISKQGYHSAFTSEQLKEARDAGIIDQRVIALGGITRENIPQVLSYGFGGAMMLGEAWQHLSSLPTVLTIAGSDSSAGAGIQQDLKTITAHGCYGCTVITAVTSQNTLGVQSVMPLPAEVVESQLHSIFSDIRIDAVKIGMIPNRQTAEVIINVLREQKMRSTLPVILDPVMISTSGTRLMHEDCASLIARELFPLCTLITPNIPEYNYLRDNSLLSESTFSLLLKGGHAEGDTTTDTLFLADEALSESFSTPRISTPNLHGTGCTLSSAIASCMAQGHDLATATGLSKRYMHQAIEKGRANRIGHGNGPLGI